MSNTAAAIAFYAAQVLASDYYYTDGVIGDFNHDGKVDFVTSRWGAGNAIVFLQKLNQTSTVEFSSAPEVFTVGGDYNAPMVYADVNDDGNKDLVTQAQLFVLPGLPASPCTVSAPYFGAPFNIVKIAQDPPLSYVQWLASGDFNVDGKPDLLTRDDYDGRFHLLINSGGTSFSQPSSFVNPGQGKASIGDINKDGRVDVALSDRTNSKVYFYYTKADGSLNAPTTFNAGISADNNAVADFNKDGRPDVLNFSGTNGSITVLTQSRTGSFALKTVTSGISPFTAFAVSDLNADNLPDVVLGGANGRIAIYKNNGNGTISLSTTLTAPGASNSAIKWLYLSDLNSDGKKDIIVDNWINSFDTISYFIRK